MKGSFVVAAAVGFSCACIGSTATAVGSTTGIPVHSAQGPCCHSPPSFGPRPFPPPGSFGLDHNNPAGISAAAYKKALAYIHRSPNGARVKLEVHAPNLGDEEGKLEQSQVDALARRLIHDGIPPGAINIKGVQIVNRRRGHWISIIVERLRPF